MMVAVLMSTYNGEKYLEEQLDSLLNQTFENWKLYVRDDGSTDGTQQIIEKYALTDDRILWQKDEQGNLGPASSFLTLLTAVDSDYYMFCDQDDVWLPNKMASALEKIKKEEQKKPNRPFLVIADAKVTDENLRVLNASFWKYNRFPPKLLAKNRNYINVFNAAPGCTMLFNKNLKNDLPAHHDQVLMHDWYLMIFALKNNSLIIDHSATMLYRQHDFNAVGAAKVNLLSKLSTAIFSAALRNKKEKDVFLFVRKYTGISKIRFYWLKLKFNIFRYIS